MISRELKYTDYNGDTREEKLYFNISEPEYTKWLLHGLKERLIKIYETQDEAMIYDFFEDVVTRSYGIKTEDGIGFKKSEQIVEDFKCTAAYEALMTELINDDEKAFAFFKSVLPESVRKELTPDAIEKATKSVKTKAKKVTK